MYICLALTARNEAHSSVNHKPRKRKGTAKGLKEKSEEYVSNKHGKLVNLGMKEAPVLRKSSCHSQIPAAIGKCYNCENCHFSV